MGKPYVDQNTQLVMNRSFFNWDYWTVGAGWFLAGEGAVYGATAACNKCLSQTIPNKPNTSYKCSIDAAQAGAFRTVYFYVGDKIYSFVPPAAVRRYEFTLTPTMAGDFAISITQFLPGPSSVYIEKVSVIGEMEGDPMYSMLYENSLAPMEKAQTEYTDFGGGEQMFRIAGRSDGTNCLIKVEP